MVTFCFDKLAAQGVGYPNLATWHAQPYTKEWRQFDQHYPRVVPLRLLMYLKRIGLPWAVETVDNIQHDAFYPVALGWFDFNFDYIQAMSSQVHDLLKKHQIRILFYYHEGDNPMRIKHRLDDLIKKHHLPDNCYIFISANTVADQLENFIYFPDHELFFGYVNREQNSVSPTDKKQHEFTLLSRTHKAWRASVVSDLWREGILNNSIWSYGLVNDSTDEGEDPIEALSDPVWAKARQDFINGAPYSCDEFDSKKQNDHHEVNTRLYQESYCHIVLETHFDADQSNGTFLTEKTFKCIKYKQPFVIVGPPGSLQALRECGYQVFDHAIDNSYDNIIDNNQRWKAVKSAIKEIKQRHNLDKWFKSCQSDVQHNKELFQSRDKLAVNSLLKRLS
jgi:hypothetical protein